MIKKKEIINFVLAALVIGYLISFRQLAFSWSALLLWLSSAGLALITIFACVIPSEICAGKFGCDTEFELWSIGRYGFHHTSSFKKPLPMWLILPLGLVFLTWGYVKWFALLVFEATPVARVGREYSEITEWELALIAASGLFMNLLLAIFSKFVGWHTFASLNVWFVFFNLIPISELNGSKIFHGSKMLWMFSFIFTAVILVLLGITNITTTVIAASIFGVAAIILFYIFHESRII